MSFILVTGGAGYVGAHCVHHLVAQGTAADRIVVFDDLSAGHREHLPPGVRFVRGDITRADEVAGVFRRQTIAQVVHFAGVSNVPDSIRDPVNCLRVNIDGGRNLLEAMRAAGCREVVFSSSCAIYGVPTQLPIAENHRQQPMSPYAESKLGFEHILGQYATEHGFKAIALRYFNAAGAGYGIGEAHEPETHLIPLAISAALRGAPLGIFGTDYETPDGTGVRDYVHVLDLARAHAVALSFLAGSEAGLTTVNLGTGRGTSVLEVVNLVGEVAGRSLTVTRGPRRQGDPPVLVADPKLAASLLGWKARRGIREIVSDAWKWHASKGKQ